MHHLCFVICQVTRDADHDFVPEIIHCGPRHAYPSCFVNLIQPHYVIHFFTPGPSLSLPAAYAKYNNRVDPHVRNGPKWVQGPLGDYSNAKGSQDPVVADI